MSTTVIDSAVMNDSLTSKLQRRKRLVLKQDEQRYFDEATAWEIDRQRTSARSQTVAWWIAGGASVIAALSVTAVMLLTPLKQVDAFVVRVDNTTGIVDIVKSLRTGSTEYNEAITKYFLAEYIHAREGYSRPLAESNYDLVTLMSDPNERRQYEVYFDPVKNPKSPLKIYNTEGEVAAKIKSISFLKKNTAAIRYRRIQRVGSSTTQSDWIATVSFRYVNSPQAEQAREINPLGFLVSDYRTDPETVLQNAESPSDDSTIPVPAPGASP